MNVLGFSGCSLVDSLIKLSAASAATTANTNVAVIMILESFAFRTSSSFYQGELVIDVDLFPRWVSASAGCDSENGLWFMILHAEQPPERFLAGEPCPDKRTGYNASI